MICQLKSMKWLEMKFNNLYFMELKKIVVWVTIVTLVAGAVLSFIYL